MTRRWVPVASIDGKSRHTSTHPSESWSRISAAPVASSGAHSRANIAPFGVSILWSRTTRRLFSMDDDTQKIERACSAHRLLAQLEALDLAGGCLGQLAYKFYRARIFMRCKQRFYMLLQLLCGCRAARLQHD